MSNHLSSETSPYLLQHANNPVDWYPWGIRALNLAKEQNKPILLSIGYSACHWCHVMAHESFEDEGVARIMNEHFINIKVDREERPDLDQIYQTAHYLLSQRSGGWPLTIFLTPDQKPFFSGTYFPKVSRYGLPGFVDLLRHIASVYEQKQDEINKQNDTLVEALNRTSIMLEEATVFSDEPIQQALDGLKNSFDRTYGGFGDAPKFPHPYELEFCLRRYAGTRDEDAREMALVTLEKMARGGIYDQLSGGFCRYSVDRYWMIPHFEKMLYDNGPLLHLYVKAWQITGNPLFRQVVEDTTGWVTREMQSPSGGYYSSLDADSEHEEGKFYVWTPDEVKTILSEEEFKVASIYYGLDRPPNFENEHWHLTAFKSLEEICTKLDVSKAQCEQLLISAKEKLFAVREQRVRPARDEKILTSWNALMIKGMVYAAKVFQRQDWLKSARQALAFIKNTMWRNDRLYATYKDGKAHLNAYLDDYAFLLDALLELMQTDFQKEDLDFARSLADVLLDQFEDKEQGGFFFTSHDHEKLIHRPKPGFDNATPSGNGIAAQVLQRLGHLTGESRYLQAAERTIALFYNTLLRQPSSFSTLVVALEEYLESPQIVILRGPREKLHSWHRELVKEYQPATLCVAIDDNVTKLPEVLNKPTSAEVNAWVCRGVECLAPISDIEHLKKTTA